MCKKDMNALVCILVVALYLAMPACAANRLTNGSFEKWEQGVPAGWTWWRRDGVPPQRDNPTPVGIEAANDEAYTGDRSIRFWKKSPAEGNRYGMLYQDVKGLPAGATLHFRARIKGKGVGHNMWCPWKHFISSPEGDFNWQEMKGTLHLGNDETELRFKIVITGKTESLWVDDLQLIVDGEEFNATVKSKKAGMGMTLAGKDYVVNGSFEEIGDGWYSAAFRPWKWQPWDGKQVTFMRDAGESKHGVYSIRISKQAGDIPGKIEQKVTGLPAGAVIRYSVALKGKGVKSASMGDVKLPDGDFAWRRFEGKARLSNDQTEYTFRINVDGPTDALHVDDVHVQLDSPSPSESEGRLFIRRMQPWAKAGFSTIRGMTQFPEPETGFQVIVRNPGVQAEAFVVNWTLCDALGAPLETDSAKMELDPLAQKRVTVPVVDLKDRRVVCLLATLTDGEGRDLADAVDFVTGAPASLAPVKSSRRFGFNTVPFMWSREASELMMDLIAAGGCGDWRLCDMHRSFNYKTKRVDRKHANVGWFVDEMQSRGITVFPQLHSGPAWASTAPPDASVMTKRNSMPQLDVWVELLKQYYAAFDFKIGEVWNEPDQGFWLTYPKTRTYTKFLNVTYDAMKKIDPNITVVGMGGVEGHGSFAEDVLKQGGKCDAISVHPYRYPGNFRRAPSIEKPLGQRASYPEMMEHLNEMTAKYNNGKPLPVYVTEVAAFGIQDDELHSIEGMEIMRAMYTVRTYLTLAGLGVETTHVFLFGEFFRGYGKSVRGDFSLKPDWWATRTLHEVAGVRKVGTFTPLTGDMFSVPMTRDADIADDTDAVAVWTVEDAAIVGTTRPIAEVRDLFGRTVPTLATKKGWAYVVPAGSVIYVIGAGELTAADIQPLVRLRADTWKVSPGKDVQYAVETTDAAKGYFGGDSVKTVSLAMDPSMVRWAVGEVELPLGDETARVPVMVPVRAKLKAGLEFNAQCYPEVRIDNNKPGPVDAKIKIRAGDKGKEVEARIPAYSTHTETLPMLPARPSEPLDVTADVVIGGQEMHVEKQLFHAKVSRAKIEIDGETGDWKGIERVKFSQWFKTHFVTIEDPSGPKDLSAQMALAYDAKNVYLLVEVTDDLHSEPYGAGLTWRGDSVQLAFDPSPTGEHGRVEMDFALSDEGEEMSIARPLNAIDITRVTFKVRREGGRTIYEFAFPLSALHVTDRGPGTRLGFSLLVNENDTGAREGWLRWSDGIGHGKHPEKYGQLLFVD